MHFSIFLPVHNGGEYIKQCVNALLNQTYTNFNLIILENFSTDGTALWLDSLSDERVIIYPSAKLLTIEENWARIVSYPKNEYITLIGHDDVLALNYLEEMNNLIIENPNATLYFSHFNYIDKTGNKIKGSKQMLKQLDLYAFTKLFLCNEIDIMGTGFLMKSSAYDNIGGIPMYPSLLFADFELWINLIGEGFIAIHAKTLFSFRLHQSATTTSSTFVFYQAYKKFIKFLKEKANNDKIFKKELEKNISSFINFYTKSIAHRLLKTKSNNGKTLNVETIIEDYETYKKEFQLASNQKTNFHLKVSKIIQNNKLPRFLFMVLKKIYKKPLF